MTTDPANCVCNTTHIAHNLYVKIIFMKKVNLVFGANREFNHIVYYCLRQRPKVGVHIQNLNTAKRKMSLDQQIYFLLFS